jgi:acetyl-CoA carboxylase carboxyltransferase component
MSPLDHNDVAVKPSALVPSLDDPLDEGSGEPAAPASTYDAALREAEELRRRPYVSAGPENIIRQHGKGRMTIWERIRVLTPEPPRVLFENWGPNLDGASLVTAILRIGSRDVALYGHDFTVRAGSMDATNGRKLARLFQLAGERGIPLVGLNDSAGAYVPRASAGSTATPRRSRRCARSAASSRASCACSGSTRAAAPTCRGRAASSSSRAARSSA